MTKTKERDDITIDDVLEKVKAYLNEEEIEDIKKAYYLAEEKHMGQYRKSGEEFITHPLNVALILTGVYADSETIEAALLHDTLEDTDCSKEDIEMLLGPEVLKLVDGVTKISKINFSTENEYLIDYYKKIIVGMSEDVRVIIIKLADRLHNMRTLFAIPEERQKVKARETLEILVPIAHHLGIYKIKSELEDLSLRYLKPDVFYDIAEKLNTTKLERDEVVDLMKKKLTNILTEHNIHHEIKGRSKSIYSIYNKLDKGKKFSDIYDLLALRILVDTEQDCYLALGIIHSKFRPLPNRFKDYIAMPKVNMYQSLHTTVFGVDGYLFEIQIRTYDMNEVAENGVASHWAYKEGKNASQLMQSNTEQKLQFFKAIIDLSNNKMSNEEFVNSVRDEVLNNNIYAFTPKGDVIELPIGATPIDFAYKIHTKVGETMVGAIVNNNIVPLDYEIQDNDIVKINTKKDGTPSREWLNIAKMTQTKNKIKSYFTKNEKELNIEKGKYSLEKEMRRRKIPKDDILNDKSLQEIFKNLKIDSLEELYLTIGNGKNAPNAVINIIKKPEEETPKKVQVVKENNDTDLVVAGIEKVKVNLANCCNPVYGDEIIGYITKSNGISVHLKNCHNVEMLDNRVVDVSWNKEIPGKNYFTSIIVYTNSIDNNIPDIVSHVQMFNIAVDMIKTINDEGKKIYEVDIWVNNKEKLNKLILDLEKCEYTIKVERFIR